MRKIIYLLALLLTSLSFAQEVLNNYKYVVVPSKFDFQKQENQHQLNTLLKSKFKQLGLESYLDSDDLPQEVKTNTCSYLTPVINAKSNMFSTKTTVDLVDCNKKVVYTTNEGFSKSKNIRASYLEAVRTSLKSFDGFQYKYEPKQVENSEEISSKTQVIDVSKDSNSGNVLISDEKQKKLNSYLYKGKQIKLQKDLTKLFLVDVESEKTIGTLYNLALKKGVYHIVLNGEKGIAYFIENGNLVVEFLDKEDSTVSVISKI